MHPDLENIAERIIAIAREHLAERGGFVPFAKAIQKNGDGLVVSVDQIEGAENMMRALVDHLRVRAGRGEVRAIGVCVDVYTTPPGREEKADSLSIRLEHADGERAIMYVPYVLMTDGTYRFEDPFTKPAQSSAVFEP